MAKFIYQAVSSQGETKSGSISAASEQEAVAKIQLMGLMIIDIGRDTGKSLSLGKLSGSRPAKKLGYSDIVDFTRQLSILIGAGLPLDRAMEIIRSVSSLQPLVELVEQLQETVRGGDTLSSALEKYPQHFSDFYINFVRSAEFSGNMAESLQDLSRYLDKAKVLREKLKSALIYPVILIGVTVISLAVIFVFVLPEFARMFEDMDAELPAVTAFVMGAANLLSDYGLVVVGLIVLAVIYFRRRMQDESWRSAWDQRLLTIPVLGDLIKKVEMARLSRSMGTLLRGGVPLLSALKIAGDSLQNRLLASRLVEATSSLQEGSGLAGPLMDAGVFPEFALQMIQVGEETGQLDKMLLKVADIYDDEVATATERMLAVLEPIMIIGLAIVIGGIVVSILVALLSINQLPV
jgi:general secretion pathway protein F